MKLNFLLSFIACCIASNMAVAQTISVAEPPYVGNVEFSNGNPLEKQKASAQTKAGASMYVTGFGKVKSKNVVQGATSSVRTTQRDNLQLIVRVNDNGEDPFNIINVFKLESKKGLDERLVEVSSYGTFSGSKAANIEYIPFSSTKYGQNSYLITIKPHLEPGEYAVTVEGSREVFNLFSID